MLSSRAPVLWLPLAANVPLQPPVAVQDVALVELQFNVVDPPAATVVETTDSEAVGITLIVTLAALLVPPAPPQVSEYVVAVLIGPTSWLPLATNEPLQAPEAVQAVALVEFHVSSDELPLATGLAPTVSVAAGITSIVTLDTVLVPPGPVQAIE
ncbi:MAG TPA: hypothetical protein VF848_01265 [Steroidobacteraceae bacterium]